MQDDKKKRYYTDADIDAIDAAAKKRQEEEQRYYTDAEIDEIDARARKARKLDISDRISDLGSAAWGGLKQTGRSVAATIDALTADNAGLEQKAKTQQEQALDKPTALQSFMSRLNQAKPSAENQEKGVWQQIKDSASSITSAAADNPEGAGQFVAEQGGNMAASLASGWAGAKAGALAGTAVSPFLGPFAPAGPVVGGIVGGIGGAVLGNQALEIGGKAIEKASDGKLTDSEREQAIKEGAVKGAVVGAVDQATLGAGKLIARGLGGPALQAAAQAEAKVLSDLGVDVTSKAAVRDALSDAATREVVAKAGTEAAKATQTLTRKSASAGAVMGTQVAGEGAGEYAGEYAATGKASVFDAVLESLSTAPQSVIETAMSLAESNPNMSPGDIVKAARDIDARDKAQVADAVASAEVQADAQAAQQQDAEMSQAAQQPAQSDAQAQPVSEPAPQADVQAQAGQDAVQQQDVAATQDIATQAADDLEMQLQNVNEQIAAFELQATQGDGLTQQQIDALDVLIAQSNQLESALIEQDNALFLQAENEQVANEQSTAAQDTAGQSGQQFVADAGSQLQQQAAAQQTQTQGRETAQSIAKSMTFPQFAKAQGLRFSELKKGTPEFDGLRAMWLEARKGNAPVDQEAGQQGTEAGSPLPPDLPPQPQPIYASQQNLEPTAQNLSSTTNGVVMQNRDRGRAASVDQMAAIARNPDFLRLGASNSPETGAPMVFAVGDDTRAIPAQNLGAQDVAVMSDGQRVPFTYAVVDASTVQPSNFADGRKNPDYDANIVGTIKALNNGRTAGVRAAYDIGTAAQYSNELVQNAERFGISSQSVQQTKSPMLVRVYSDKDNVQNMAAKSQGTALGMSASELATQDASFVMAGPLADYVPGDVSSAANRDYVRGIIGRMSQAGLDTASMTMSDGSLSQIGRQRIQAATTAAAYSDSALIDEMFESLDTDIKSIGDALKTVAGEWAGMRQAVQAGQISATVDTTANLMQAVDMVKRARAERKSIYDATRQVDILTGSTPDPLTIGFVQVFYGGRHMTRAVGKDKVVEQLRAYVNAAMSTTSGPDLFGDTIGASDILNGLANNGVQDAATAAEQASNKQSIGVSDSRADTNALGREGLRSGAADQGPGVNTDQRTESRRGPKPEPGNQKSGDGNNTGQGQVTAEQQTPGKKSKKLEGMAVGQMPNTAEPVTVRDGVVYIGDYPAQDFETGDDVIVQDGAQPEDVKQALIKAGAIGKNTKFFGAGAAAQKKALAKPVVSKNTIITDDAVAKAREIFRKKVGRLNSGVDPDLIQAGTVIAIYHIERGARSFAAYAQAMVDDMGDAIKPYLKSFYMGVKYDPRASDLEGLSSAQEVDEADINAILKGAQDAPSVNSGLESNSPEPATQSSVVDSIQSTESGRDEQVNEQNTQSVAEKPERGQQNDVGLSDGGPIADRESSNIAVGYRDAADDSARILAGYNDDSAGGDLGEQGIQADSFAKAETEALADERAQATQEAEQRQANKRDSGGIKPGDLQDIKRTLPLLNDGQQEDVAMAEKRFSKPDGYGMLFTNGTGTGKTWLGLGVVKRSIAMRGDDVLIVVPDDKMINDWIDTGKKLGVNLSKLDDTNTAGKGAVITTYANLGANNKLATRKWSLVVADEAHNLSKNAAGEETTYLKNLRAITYQQGGVFQANRMREAKDYARLEQINEKLNSPELQKYTNENEKKRVFEERARLREEAESLNNKLTANRKRLEQEFADNQGEKRTRLLALSATPFAYEKSIDWANGYLFDYNEGQPQDGPSGTGGRPYNSGSNQDRFMMTHFGYSMRYNKLTKPDPTKVDTGLMQRNFNGWLKKRGVLSGRMLDVKADYDRRFVLIESALGNKIDDALNYLKDQSINSDNKKGFGLLNAEINDKFDYLSRRYLLEAIKADASIPIVKQHLRLNRKVIVFHDYKKGGGFNPFKVNQASNSSVDASAFNDARREFNDKFSDLVNLPMHEMQSPITAYKKAFGDDVLLVNGDEKPKDLLQRYKQFNDDNVGPKVMLVQSAKNAGWSGHDTTGEYQRVLINLGQPTAPTLAIQQEGRIYRTGQVSNAIMRYLNTGTSWEKWTFASTIAGRASAAENLSMGENARALKDSFIAAFEQSDAYPPGHEGEGTGGKEIDKAANNAITAYDRAKSYYFATQRKTQANKAQEGVDYFATPEPVGFKMVEWLDLLPGDSALEPSAGHGAIARWFPDLVKKTAIEPSNILRAKMAMAMNAAEDRLLDGTFEDLNLVNKYDGIAMNPPFGSGGKTAIDHLAKAAMHLRDGGRVVALIPTGPAADKRFDAWLYETNEKTGKPVHSDLHLTADITLPRVTFERAGTSVATRIVVIDKGEAATNGVKRLDFSNAENIQDLFNRIEDITIPPRKTSKPEAQPEQTSQTSGTGAEKAQPTAKAANLDAVGMFDAQGASIVEHTTKAGKVIRGVIAKNITLADAKKIDPYTFKKDGGLFIREVYVVKNDGRLSRASMPNRENATGMQKADVEKIVGDITKDWGNAPPIVVLNSAADLKGTPAGNLLERKLSDTGGGENLGAPQAFFALGNVYVFSDKMGDENTVKQKILHEVVGHYGVRGILGDDVLPALRRLISTRPDLMRKKAAEYNLDLSNPSQMLEAAEEVIAEMAETDPKLGWVKNIIAMIRSWLASKPAFKELRMTDAEIVREFIAPARGFVERNRQSQGWQDSGRFARATLNGEVPPKPSAMTRMQERKNKIFDAMESVVEWDSFVSTWQDRFVDLKRLRKKTIELKGVIADNKDPYLGEELYHERLASRKKHFIQNETTPILEYLFKSKIKLAEFEQYLHARHAKEANAEMMRRNPSMAQVQEMQSDAAKQVKELELALQKAQANGSSTAAIVDSLKMARDEQKRVAGMQGFRGTEEDRAQLSGMSDSKAEQVLAEIEGGEKAAEYKAAAKMMGDFIRETQEQRIKYGLSSRSQIEQERKMFKYYVPLHRDEAHETFAGIGAGTGFNVRRKVVKQRTGSTSAVTNIFAHTQMAREQVLTMGERSNVAKRLYMLLKELGQDQDIATLDRAPTVRLIDKKTGTVVTMPMVGFEDRANVLTFYMGGKKQHIVFNEDNPAAIRMAQNIKNMDMSDNQVALWGVNKTLNALKSFKRYMGAINTQYNPIWGFFNLLRDASGVLLNLTTTKIAGKQLDVAKKFPSAWRAVYRLNRGKNAANDQNAKYIKEYKELQSSGGLTGYAASLRDPFDATKELEKIMAKPGRGNTRKAFDAVGKWLSDYNQTTEDVFRLAAFMTARENGLSTEQAASIAKNITVNFNRKGSFGGKVDQYFLFFNAAVQSSARIFETLQGPKGRQILMGGVMLGAITTAYSMAMMGALEGDDEENEYKRIPPFVRERSIIIATSPTTYVAIPVALGFHAIPNIGRLAMESAFGKRGTGGDFLSDSFSVFASAFNPLGGAGSLMQTISPTVTDIPASLAENLDWTGQKIYQENFNNLDPVPGIKRVTNEATFIGKGVALAANRIGGGTDYVPPSVQFLDITPDQVDYVIGQLFGGPGREIVKASKLVGEAASGEGVQLRNVPLISRLVGTTTGRNAEGNEFYKNLKDINMAQNEIVGRFTNGEDVQEVYLEKPEAQLIPDAKSAYKQVRAYREEIDNLKRQSPENEKELIRLHNEAIQQAMKDLNDKMEAVRSAR